MATLPGSSAIVRLGPPLSASGPIEIGNIDSHVVGLVARQAVVRRVVKSATFEFIGARLSDNIDIAADEIAVGDVVGGDVDINGLDGVD